MKRILPILTLALIGLASAASAQPRAGNVDSLEQLLQSGNTSETARIEIYDALARAYRKNDFQKALKFAEEGLSLARKKDDPGWQGIFYYNIGNTYFFSGRRRTARAHIEQAFEVFQSTGNAEGVSDVQNALGRIEMEEGNLDKALDHFQHSNRLRDSLGLLKKLADGIQDEATAYRNLGELDKARGHLMKAAGIQEKTGDEAGLGRAYAGLIAIFGMRAEADSGLFYAQKAIESFEKTDDIHGLASVHLDYGNLYNTKRQFEQAIEHFSKARELFERLENREMIAIANFLAGQVFASMGEAEKAMELIGKAIPLLEKTGNKRALYAAYQNYAFALSEFEKKRGREDAPEALDTLIAIYDKSLQLSRASGDRLGMGRALSNKGMMQMKKGEFESAIESLFEGIAIREEIGIDEGLYTPYLTLGRCYLELDEPKKALRYFEKARALLKDSKELPNTIEFYKSMGKAYAQVGDYQSGYEALMDYSNMKDTLFTQEKYTAIAEIEARYQTQQKVDSIALMQARAQLDAAELKRRNNWLLLLLAIAAIAAAAAFVFLRGRQKERQAKEQLAAKNAQIHLLNRELSHRVKNNLQFVSSLLEMQGRRAGSEDARAALQESENRLQAMALLHRRLYQQEEDATTIELGSYLEELCGYLQSTYPAEGPPPEIRMEIEPMQVDAEQAGRLGLIVNELLTNSFKHAFHEVEQPEVFLGLQRTEDGYIRLSYRDNGKGMPVGYDVQNSRSLGLKLIHTLSRQLGGSVEVSSEEGARYEFEFHGMKKTG